MPLPSDFMQHCHPDMGWCQPGYGGWCRLCVPLWLWVVRGRSQEVVVVGGSGDVEVGGSLWSRTKMFVCSSCACEFLANTAHVTQ